MNFYPLQGAAVQIGRRLRGSPELPARALPIMLALIGLLLGSPVALCQAPGPEPVRLAARLPSVEAQWKAKVNANTVSIIAGSPDETYLDITHDLAVVLNNENLRVLPIVGMGGAQNIRDVLYLKGVDIGITSSHMLRYFASTGEFSATLDQRLAFITRLFLEEMHVVAGPGIKTVEDLAGKKVNFSDPGSSTQITAHDVFGLLSVAVVEVNVSQADAIAMVKSGEIAATVVFSGKPAGVFAHISGGDNLHLLEVPYTRTLENTYFPAQLESALYPNLIVEGQTVQTIAVDAVLVTNNWPAASDRYQRVAKFVEAFFSRFAELRKPPRHPKWLEVNLGAELPGWQRLPVAQDWLGHADEAEVARKRAKFDQFLSNNDGKRYPSLPEAEKQRLFRQFLDWSAGESNSR
jgi:TRAP-type uncharacterized transport system substrate-binding protein